MNFLKGSFLLLAIAVVLGAFGAHTLKELLQPESLKAWHTGVEYQVYHGLAMMFLSLNAASSWMNAKRMKIAQYLFLAGIVMFSGSIYFLTTQDISGWSLRWLGPITPIGGVCFIAGWIVCFFSVKKGEG
jgi:uncharacterized membrane protein YgdD (TMEM256/DUF423 family)